ncbi:hypothetical protein F2Q70_00002455 [Brassica cretica]|uniref:Uncharacterized protein n=1 Tax=Brassica cretica TaxID=69181 RepID=A0A8S9IPI4_BRACR|nr:hypothetical protein F2Q70_00002455 [Brassica cretica]
MNRITKGWSITLTTETAGKEGQLNLVAVKRVSCFSERRQKKEENLSFVSLFYLFAAIVELFFELRSSSVFSFLKKKHRAVITEWSVGEWYGDSCEEVVNKLRPRNGRVQERGQVDIKAAASESQNSAIKD